MKLVFGPAKRREYQSFAKRFSNDYIASFVGDVDGYLADVVFQESVARWIKILDPSEIVIARSAKDVGAASYLERSRKSHDVFAKLGIKASETFYSPMDGDPARPPMRATIDCVDDRLNLFLLNGGGGDYTVRFPGAVGLLLDGDPIARSEAELLVTLNVGIGGYNHCDCKWYASCRNHRPARLADDLEFHRREISHAKKVFQAKGGFFAGDIRRL